MDYSTILFMAFVVVMSGGVGYLADRVGSKVGKKKLSLLKIRPRQIASIASVSAGMVVSLVSIAFILAFSADLRRVMFQGRRLIEQRDAAQRNLESVNQEISRTKGQRDELSQQVDLKNADLLKSAAALDERKRQIAKLSGDVHRLNASLDVLRHAARQYQAQIKPLETKVADAQTRLLAKQQSLDDVNGKLSQVRADLANARAELAASIAKRDTAVKDRNEIAIRNEQLTRENGNLESLRTRLEADVSQLREAQTTLKTDYEAKQKQIVAINLELTRKNNELDDARSRLQLASTDLTRFESITKSSRTSPLIFAYREELARLAVEPGSTADSAAFTVTTLMRAVRSIATERGAKANGAWPVAAFAEHVDPDGRHVVTADEVERQTVRAITKSKSNLVVIAYSAVNTFLGEPVAVEVVVLANPFVYRRGQFVAESTIDGSQDDVAIYRQLAAYLSGKVTVAVRRAKLIPRAGSDRQFGEVGMDELWTVVKRIREANRIVRVQALAADDTRAADALRLEFRVR